MTTDNTRVRSTRTTPESSFEVTSATIGCRNSFALASKNVSKTGLLLSTEGYSSVPFRKLTLIDMTIDPTGKIFESPLSCLGKVVRIVESDGSRCYGVQIVQIEPEAQERWEQMVSTTETVND